MLVCWLVVWCVGTLVSLDWRCADEVVEDGIPGERDGGRSGHRCSGATRSCRG